MADASLQDPFVRRALAEIEGWAGTLGSEVVVERVGAAIRRVKLHGSDSPQVLFLRFTPSATYLEPYFSEPTDDEVAMLKAGFSDAEDVIFPYLRGGRGRGALLRLRNESDLASLKAVLSKRCVAT